MSELKLELYNTINLKLEEDLDFFYASDISKITYKTLLRIWSDFVFKKYASLFKYNDDLIYHDMNKTHQTTINLCKKDTKLGLILENLFSYHIDSSNDDLMLFYIKGSDRVLIKLKSYTPLSIDKNKILPYWNLYITQTDFVESIKNYLEASSNDNLCILCF